MANIFNQLKQLNNQHQYRKSRNTLLIRNFVCVNKNTPRAEDPWCIKNQSRSLFFRNQHLMRGAFSW